MKDTVVVRVTRYVKHPKYKKYMKRTKKYHVHNEGNRAKEGETVTIRSCRPLSKTKHHRLLRVVTKAPERAIQVSAEEVMTGKAPEAR